MSNKKNTYELGNIYKVPTFQPEDIAKYNQENIKNPTPTIPQERVDEIIIQFNKLLTTLEERIKTSGLESQLVEPATKELSSIRNDLNQLNTLDNIQRGELFTKLHDIIHENSHTFQLLSHYGDNEEVQNLLRERSGLISGLVASSH